MAKRRKSPPKRHLAQFGIIECWKGKTLVRIFHRDPDGPRLIAAIGGSQKLARCVLEIGVDKQLNRMEIEAGARRLAKADGFELHSADESEVSLG